jgi:rhodanese-related sulfurtransferase
VAVRLIDLRSTAQFSAASIEGSEQVTAEDILEDGLSSDDRDPVLLFCEEGTISSLLADTLRSWQEKSIFHLEGGFQGWSSAQ